MCRFKKIVIKIPKTLFADKEKPILIFIQNLKGLQNGQNNLEKEDERLLFSNFKASYKNYNNQNSVVVT